MGLLDFIIKVGVDGSGAKKGLDDTRAHFEAFSKSVGSKLAVAFSTTAVLTYARDTAAAALESKKLAEQLGTTSEMLERMQKAASIKGLSDEFFPKAIVKMQTFMEEALGDEKKQNMLAQFGITFHDISGEAANAADAIEKVGKAISTMNLTNDQRAFLTQMFGKQGSRGAGAVAILPDTVATLTRDESGALQQLGQTFEELGRKSASFFKKGFAKFVLFEQSGVNQLWDKVFGTSFGVKTKGASGDFNPTPANPVLEKKIAEDKKKADESWEDYLHWAMTPEKQKASPRTFRSTIQSDSLARIGNFLGDAGRGIGSGMADRSLRAAEKTAAATEEINRKVQSGGIVF